MDTVGHPYLFQIGLELLPLFGRLVAHIVLIDTFTYTTDGEIVAVVLVPEDITSFKGRLRQVVDHLFLSE